MSFSGLGSWRWACHCHCWRGSSSKGTSDVRKRRPLGSPIRGKELTLCSILYLGIHFFFQAIDFFRKKLVSRESAKLRDVFCVCGVDHFRACLRVGRRHLYLGVSRTLGCRLSGSQKDIDRFFDGSPDVPRYPPHRGHVARNSFFFFLGGGIPATFRPTQRLWASFQTLHWWLAWPGS